MIVAVAGGGVWALILREGAPLAVRLSPFSCTSTIGKLIYWPTCRDSLMMI